MSGFTEADVSDQSGKCFIVTGANTGVGFEAARVLAARGARVLLACRDKAKAEAAMARIGRSTRGADVAFLPLDQADLGSVRACGRAGRAGAALDALINNAGVMRPPLTRTKQGFELQFGVNHLGCFALTALLLPELAKTAGARVVVTASIAHRRGRIAWDDLNAEKSYDRSPALCRQQARQHAVLLRIGPAVARGGLAGDGGRLPSRDRGDRPGAAHGTAPHC